METWRVPDAGILRGEDTPHDKTSRQRHPTGMSDDVNSGRESRMHNSPELLVRLLSRPPPSLIFSSIGFTKKQRRYIHGLMMQNILHTHNFKRDTLLSDRCFLMVKDRRGYVVNPNPAPSSPETPLSVGTHPCAAGMQTHEDFIQAAAAATTPPPPPPPPPPPSPAATN